MTDRARAAAAAAGVLGLTVAWVTAGLATDGFDPVRQSISQLQRDGTATGMVMTVAFAGFSAGALAVSPVLGQRVGRAPQVALVVAAVATLGAALAPLGQVRGGRQDVLHLVFGTSGYLSLSVLPLLAGRALVGRPRGVSYALGALASGCLLGTIPADAVSGALQRAGFLAGHAWLLGFAVSVLRSPAPVSGKSAPARGNVPRGRRRRRPSSPR